jgi:lysophospholipase L1-like esterase
MIYGPRSRRQESNDYGVMGHVAVMDHGLVDGSEDVVMHIEPAGKKHAPHQYFSQIRLLASHVEGEVRSKDTTLAVKPYGVSVLLEQTDRCEIRLHGKGKVYGVSLETPTGVMVDNIPMRGSSGVIFTRLESRSLSDYYSATNTRLLILQYGGNMIPQSSKKSTIDGYVKNLRTQINHLRRCAPYASILFIGPSDMSTRINGKMVTYPMVPYLDKKLREMAQEEKISYWSMYEAMGGKNSMVEWVEKGLAGSDYVHFTRAGANKVGQMLGKWIDEGKR